MLEVKFADKNNKVAKASAYNKKIHQEAKKMIMLARDKFKKGDDAVAWEIMHTALGMIVIMVKELTSGKEPSSPHDFAIAIALLGCFFAERGNLDKMVEEAERRSNLQVNLDEDD